MTPREKALEAALKDMRAGWRYIRANHGDLYGVGWDRAEQLADAALSLPASAGEEPKLQMPADPEWYARRADLEGDAEIGAGIRDEICSREFYMLESAQWQGIAKELRARAEKAEARLAELEARPAPAELRERVARAICKTDRFDTGEGTCAALCMEQLGDPRRKGCGHALRVHGTLVDAILAALPELAGTENP
jgi:GNAT superfamily N-acetyltransferase